MRTHIIIILILIISISLFSDANSNDNLSTGHRSNYSTINKYSNSFESANKITLGISVAITEFYLVDTEWHTLSWINVDRFNNNQYNHSVFTLVDFGLMFIASKFLPANYSRMSILNPVNLTNASHNIFPFGNPDYTKEKNKEWFQFGFLFKEQHKSIYIPKK